MGISEHCLVKSMADANTTFSDLAKEVKYQLARQMLAFPARTCAPSRANWALPASASSTALSLKWSGQTPGRWRSKRIGRPTPRIDRGAAIVAFGSNRSKCVGCATGPFASRYVMPLYRNIACKERGVAALAYVLHLHDERIERRPFPEPVKTCGRSKAVASPSSWERMRSPRLSLSRCSRRVMRPS